jgi:hypothetical protein
VGRSLCPPYIDPVEAPTDPTCSDYLLPGGVNHLADHALPTLRVERLPSSPRPLPVAPLASPPSPRGAPRAPPLHRIHPSHRQEGEGKRAEGTEGPHYGCDSEQNARLQERLGPEPDTPPSRDSYVFAGGFLGGGGGGLLPRSSRFGASFGGGAGL